MTKKRFFLLFVLALAQAQGDNGNPNLDPEVIQRGSFTDGSGSIGADAVQAPSSTSQNNFINFCKGQTLTDGLQHTDGSCNGIVMGQIPAKNNMISVVITNPQNGDSINSGQNFDITLQVSNLDAGSFTNAAATYYAAPQQLKGGKIVGHVHVTVQDTGSNLNPTEPLDPTKFSFFKGINDAGNGRGRLTAAVEGGLPAGNYRLCTLTSAANHQPVIMPVAQRGSQDDCVRFTVTGNGNTINPAADNGEKGQAAAELVAEAVRLGPGAPDPGGNNNNNNGGDGGNNNNNGGGGNNNGGGGNNNGGGGNNNGGGGNNNNGGGGNNNGAGGNNNGGGGNNNNGGGGGNNNNGGGGGNNNGGGNGNGGEGEGTPTSSPAAQASETASNEAPEETPRTGQGKGKGKGKRGADRLARLSRRRRFVA